MIGASWRQRGIALRRFLLPILSTLLLILLFLLPWGGIALSSLASAIALIAIFYWSLRRPEAISPWSAAIIGLCHDLLGLAPLGVGLVVFTIAQAAIAGQRKRLDGMPFLFVWAVFALTAAVAVALAWLLAGLSAGSLLPVPPLLRLYLGAFLLYPPLAYWLSRLERRLDSWL